MWQLWWSHSSSQPTTMWSWRGPCSTSLPHSRVCYHGLDATWPGTQTIAGPKMTTVIWVLMRLNLMDPFHLPKSTLSKFSYFFIFKRVIILLDLNEHTTNRTVSLNYLRVNWERWDMPLQHSFSMELPKPLKESLETQVWSIIAVLPCHDHCYVWYH